MLAIYTRLSREDEASSSIENQQREGIAFALSNGYEYKVYDEGSGVSGGDKIDERPALKQLFEDLPDLTAVWVRDQNRIERNTGTWHNFSTALAALNIKYYESGKQHDLSDPDVWAMTAMKSVWNTRERRSQSKKTKKAIRDNVAQGKVHGIIPYGYKKGAKAMMETHEDEAKIVREIFKMSLAGRGTMSIAEALNELSTPTRYNQYEGTIKLPNNKKADKKAVKWAGNTIRGIIINPIYKGERIWGEEAFKCPSIVEPNHWQKVNDNLKKNANNSGKKVEHKYLLKGIIKCGRCGRNYYGRSRQNKRDHYYTCSSKRRGVENCGNRSINIDFIEGLIWEHFFSQGLFRERLQDYFKQLESEPRIKEIEEQTKNYNAIIKEQTEQKKELVRLAAKGVLEEEDIAQEMKTIRTAINDAEIHLQRLSEQKSSYNSLSDNAETINGNLMSIENANISFKEKSDFLKEYLSRTVIHFDQPTEHYFIEIIPKIEGMDKIVFVAPYSKKFAYEYVHENVLVHGYDGQSYYKDFTPDHLLIQGFDATFERIFGMTMEEHLKNFDFSQCDLPPSDRELNA
jgi:site-specific DNA recombinase